MDFFKKIFAVLMGIISGSITLSITDRVMTMIYPLPDYIYTTDKAALAEHYINTPVSAFAVMVAGWAAGGFIAGMLSTWLAPVLKPTYAYFCGLIFLCATIFYLLTNPGGPWWLWIAGILTWLPMAHIGFKTAADIKFRSIQKK